LNPPAENEEESKIERWQCKRCSNQITGKYFDLMKFQQDF